MYEVGTKVKIVSKRKTEGRLVFATEDMVEDWCGKELTIKEIILTKSVPYYKVEENRWFWDNSFIDYIVDDFCTEDDNDDIECASFGKYFTKFAVRSGGAR